MVTVRHDAVLAGERLSITFHRTLRVPDDGQVYPLPPGLGRFPLRRAEDYAEHLPHHWRGDVFLPIYAREALWIGFEGAEWKPNAVKIAAGGVNVITGGPWDEHLHPESQDYVVCPEQPWIDGINTGAGSVRQFVAMTLGSGYTIEAQTTGRDQIGGLQFVVFEPKPGRFPDRPPQDRERPRLAHAAAPASPLLGVAIGGAMQQKIYPDPLGVDTWDPNNHVSLRVHFMSPEAFSVITSEPEPATPVDAYAYTEAGLPWFELYDERKRDLPAAEELRRLRSIRDLEHGDAEPTIEITRGQVKRVGPRLDGVSEPGE